MRRFSSYGPVNDKLHYYAPRKELIDRACLHLIGENPEEGGHYITVWAPRQTGKSWAMREALHRLRKDERFDVLKINLEHLKMEADVGEILRIVGRDVLKGLNKKIVATDSQDKFQAIFERGTVDKPLVLILDEFDALAEEAIGAIVAAFRNIHNIRQDQSDKSACEKDYLLHGAALIGVRSVLGVENVKGSPFNVQRSVRIPNLTFEEVEGMFRWHERESGQKVDDGVIERIFHEFRGQPGLTCWFGELLTEGWDQFVPPKDRPITSEDFEKAYRAASNVLPNNNILNIISKAKLGPHRDFTLELFQTKEKIKFRYDNPNVNFLYMNGVIEREENEEGDFVRFSSPFVQKRLFSYFSDEMFGELGRLVNDPFRPLDDVIDSGTLNVRNLTKLYSEYLAANRDWSLKNAPRRSDMRIREAVFHFSLYSWLDSFLEQSEARVFPEFPTGNGKIDLIIRHAGKTYGLELKSYVNHSGYRKALIRAAGYGKELKLKKISLIFFVERIDDENRNKLEADFLDPETGVKVEPIFVETGA